MKFTVLLVVLLGLTSCVDKSLKSKLRPQIADTLRKLDKYGYIAVKHQGDAGTPSPHLETMSWFEQNINSDEALTFSPVIKLL